MLVVLTVLIALVIFSAGFVCGAAWRAMFT